MIETHFISLNIILMIGIILIYMHMTNPNKNNDNHKEKKYKYLDMEQQMNNDIYWHLLMICYIFIIIFYALRIIINLNVM